MQVPLCPQPLWHRLWKHELLKMVKTPWNSSCQGMILVVSCITTPNPLHWILHALFMCHSIFSFLMAEHSHDLRRNSSNLFDCVSRSFESLVKYTLELSRPIRVCVLTTCKCHDFPKINWYGDIPMGIFKRFDMSTLHCQDF